MSEPKLNNPIIMWFRQDLRLTDNPALHYAAQSGRPIVAIYIRDTLTPGIRDYGAAQRWWLHHSLTNLAADLNALGVDLVFRSGAAADVIQELARETGATAIVWNRRYGEAEQAVDAQIKSSFEGEANSFAGLLMHEPKLIRTGSGNPYKVYTPFWKNFSANTVVRTPYPKPDRLNGFSGIACDTITDWNLLPSSPDWSDGISAEWKPGEQGADERLQTFLSDNMRAYNTARDLPGPDRTSKLSPHLRFGEVSPHQLWHACHNPKWTADDKAREIWAKELVWREFSYHLLQEWTELATENFNTRFDTFPWEPNPAFLKAWRTGQTGYPIVDAGMRQLWQTGWMHNRVRMIVGSFLVKHLLQDWREGERWFWDTLVDGDPAANPAQWQWVAGTGADAAPYFRVFNPILQAEKFDKDGSYIRKYVPELEKLPSKYLSAPWEAPLGELKMAGVTLGKTYPHPIVDHKEARNLALAALNTLNPKEDED